VVFSTAEETAEPEATIDQEEPGEKEQAERAVPVAFHGECIARVERHFIKQLVRQTRSSYATPGRDFAVVCAVSKAYKHAGHPSYWFAFHPYQRSFLENVPEGFLVLGCGSAETVFVIPVKDLISWLPELWTTENKDRMYWHLRVHLEGKSYMLDRKEGRERMDITKYLLS
jgi:hypothetical protein